MESHAHKEYVQNAIDYIKRKFDLSNSQIAADLGDANMLPPKTVDGFRADIYVNTSQYIIIGEAKTDNDVNNNHTLAQFASYVKEAKSFDKERQSSCLALSLHDLLYETLSRDSAKKNDVPNITFHTVDPMIKGEILI